MSTIVFRLIPKGFFCYIVIRKLFVIFK